ILENKEITVQPLATDATGKAKKYERTGPQEFVPFFFEEVTIPNIIAACNKHFKKRAKGMSCDVLASERAPSCTKISQLPSLKLFHIRFVMTDDQMNSEGCSTAYSRYSGINSSPVRFGSKASTSTRADPIIVPHSTSAIGVKRKLESSFRAPVNNVPKSLGITTMMRLGQAITATETSQEIVEVSRFNINDMVWSPPVSVHFTIEKEKFAEGGFRAAYKATSKSPNFEGKTYIVKRFLPKTVELIGAVNETQEDHVRKSIQMQALANNFAEQVAAKVEKDRNKNVFGKPFRYVDAFLGKSNRKLLLVDIQGGEYNLTDPEIATVSGIYDNDDHLLFCAGNLSTEAYLNFFNAHKCNAFCNLLGLVPEEVENDA
ncbi:transient receptor potential cation channel subfamily M member 6-like, partial [Paramuricea clavata]